MRLKGGFPHAPIADMQESLGGVRVIDVSGYQPQKRASKQWRELIKKIWEADPLQCPRCGSEMKIVALIDEEAVIERILRHLHLWEEEKPARAPPEVPCQETTYEPFYDDYQLCPEAYHG